MLLFSIKNKIQLPALSSIKEDKVNLVSNEYLEYDGKLYKMTDKGKSLVSKINSYFITAKKKTDEELMGKEFFKKINIYRETFPSGKLPHGKPARQNVKALNESFRWFFETYDYTWEEVMKATKMYVSEYVTTDYLYMQTSQYFIAKQDKHKVKTSTLSDYCDMIRDGIQTKSEHFTEKVV
tara:strand:+ start:3903 stop:4445 length:543 start_codon:yes stop_codon:yes gene_type:complete